ncbi:MAG TPA: hypothetical protein VFV50_17700 [Bdellovibrionales bacterium]|nr:hypothetical protein [Bdellovibrionales bacterium]
MAQIKIILAISLILTAVTQPVLAEELPETAQAQDAEAGFENEAPDYDEEFLGEFQEDFSVSLKETRRKSS